MRLRLTSLMPIILDHLHLVSDALGSPASCVRACILTARDARVMDEMRALQSRTKSTLCAVRRVPVFWSERACMNYNALGSGFWGVLLAELHYLGSFREFRGRGFATFLWCVVKKVKSLMKISSFMNLANRPRNMPFLSKLLKMAFY